MVSKAQKNFKKMAHTQVRVTSQGQLSLAFLNPNISYYFASSTHSSQGQTVLGSQGQTGNICECLQIFLDRITALSLSVYMTRV